VSAKAPDDRPDDPAALARAILAQLRADLAGYSPDVDGLEWYVRETGDREAQIGDVRCMLRMTPELSAEARALRGEAIELAARGHDHGDLLDKLVDFLTRAYVPVTAGDVVTPAMFKRLAGRGLAAAFAVAYAHRV